MAPTTRERTGTSAKVIIPVRWDHSEVTSRMPTTGSSTAAGCSPMPRMEAKVWSAASPVTVRAITATTVIATVATCSQKPARVLTILRSSTATLADLAALVEESRAAGMRITARIELGDAAPPAAVGRTTYRIAQEGLTNARKHAPGAAVTLTLRAPDGDLQVEVRSLAPVAVASASPLPGAGTGLIGLAERVTLAGGELEHGVDPDGAFVLRARLPR